MKKLPPSYKYTHNVNEGKACMVFVEKVLWNIYREETGSRATFLIHEDTSLGGERYFMNGYGQMARQETGINSSVQ